MSEYLRIVGNESLVRDKASGAVINCNTSDYENYKKKINASMQMKQKLQEQEEQIAEIKNDIAEIKELLLRILSTK